MVSFGSNRAVEGGPPRHIASLEFGPLYAPPGATRRRGIAFQLLLTATALCGSLWLAPVPAKAVAVAGAPNAAVAAWQFPPLLQDSPPIENRIRLIVRDILREIRRAVKLSKYFITSSPTWWWIRAKRALWPLVFAIAALLLDSALLAAWKNDGMRVLVNYVPMMLYVYGRLFVSSGTSVVVRLAVVGAIAYGIWPDDFLRDGRWMSIGTGRIDDMILIFVSVRAFVASCPEQLVELYAGRAIALRNRLIQARSAS